MNHLKTHRWLLFFSALLYPIFGYVNAHVLPHPFETDAILLQRVAIAALFFIGFSLSYSTERIKHNFYYIITGLIYLGCTHLLYLGYLCSWNLNHVIGLVMVFILTSLVFQKGKHLIYFYAYFNAVATFVLLTSTGAGNESSVSPAVLLFIFPTITIVMFIVLSGRIKAQKHILDLNDSLNDANAKLEETQAGLTDRNLRLVEYNLEIEIQVAKYNALYNTGALGIFMLDTDAKITQVNLHFEEITTYTQQEALSKSFPDLIHADDRPNLIEAWVAMTSNNAPFDVEFRFVTKVGIKWFRTTIASIIFRGQNEGYIGTMTDITESKRIAELNVRNIELQMRHELDEKSAKVKQQFFNNARRELRTPINSILGFAQLLTNSKGLTPKQHEYLHQLESNSTSLLALIDNMLDFNSFVDDRFVLEPTMVNLAAYIEEKVKPVEYLIREKGLDFNLAVDPAMAEAYLVDSFQLFKAINSILKNAYASTDKGAITVAMKILSRSGETDDILFEITDTGGQLSSKQLAILSNMSNNPQLTLIADDDYFDSLGLKLAKLILNTLGGFLGAQSNQPNGTSYSFVLRLVRGAAPALADKQQEHSTTRPIYHFLIVEDNEFNQIVLKDTLLEWNPLCKIDIVDNGLKGVEKASANRYDLIFMDIRMPVMDGHEATRKILHELPAPYNQVTIVAVTAHALQTEKDFCLSNGMKAYITKPFDPDNLLAEVSNLLQTNAQGQKSAASRAVSVDNYKVIDPQVIINATKGKKDRIQKLVEMYLGATPSELNQLQQLLQAQDYKTLSGVAHSIKPKFTFLGMPALCEIAKSIELGAKENPDNEFLKNQIRTLTSQANLSYEELKQFLTTL